MVKGETSTGFVFEIDENVLNDMEVVDAIAETVSDNDFEKFNGLSTLCTKLLGAQKKKLYDHVRESDGRVPLDRIDKELVEIFKAAGSLGKN